MLPSDIARVVFDNEYSHLQDLQINLIMKSIFGDEIHDIHWFLYEFKLGELCEYHLIDQFGNKQLFTTDEDFYEYLKNI